MTDGRHLEGRKVVIRADASPTIGGGHIMRCLTLADILKKRGARTIFVCALIPAPLAAAIEEKGHGLRHIPPGRELAAEDAWSDSPVLSIDAQRRDAEQTLAAAGEADWIVLDHYHLDATWLEALEHGPSSLVIDDLANRRQQCDILVDQTFGRTAADYKGLVPAGCRVLAGAQFALLRPEFPERREAALQRREEPQPLRRLLVSFGLADTGTLAAVAVSAVQAADLAVDVDLVIGFGVPFPAQSAPNVHLHENVRDMSRLMAEADFAIGAAGTTSWERCCLGLPTICIVLADNQRLVADNLARAGAVVIAPRVEDISFILRDLAANPDKLLAMSAAAAAITEGRGAELVADAIEGKARTRQELRIRRACMDDSRNAWLWRNDPETRRASQTNAPIKWPDHRRWWQNHLDSPESLLLVAEASGRPAAIIRFDHLAKHGHEVSINIAPSLRGYGLGGAILAKACDFFFASNGPTPLSATIHRDNEASRRIFEKLGFVRAEPLSNDPFEPYVREVRAEK